MGVNGARTNEKRPSEAQGVLRQHVMTNQDVRDTFTRGAPASLDQLATWRLTLSLGLRCDYFNGYVPAQEIPATAAGCDSPLML